MLDLKWVRHSPDEVRERLRIRGAADTTDAAIARLGELDEERRRLIGEGEGLKARRNAVSQEVGERKRRNDPAEQLVAEMRTVGDRIKEIDERLREVEGESDDILLRTPNAPDPGVPAGGEESNVVVREWGAVPSFTFEPRPHWEIGAELGLMDLAKGAKVAGTGFPAFTGPGARLQRALVNWMLDLHTTEHGYTEASPPLPCESRGDEGDGAVSKVRRRGRRI